MNLRNNVLIFSFLISLNTLIAQSSSVLIEVYNKIAFSRQESQNDWDIWIMDINGSNQTRIHNSTATDIDPHFRFDGKKIVFSRFTQGSPPTQDIYTIDPDGTNLTNLTADIPNEVSRPKWSWDGVKIVYSVTVGPQNKDIYIMNSDGSNKAAIITGTNNDEWPSFSPDGAYIIFQRYIGSIQNQKSKICIYRISDGIITDITDGDNLDEMPIYSPSGNDIIFKRGTTNPEIYRMELNNLSLTNLTNNSVVDDAPMYSYDGMKIAWMQATTGMSTAEIWIMNNDGMNKIRLTNNNLADFNPTFGPINTSSSNDTENPITDNNILLQNYPNPFNSCTTIKFYIPHTSIGSMRSSTFITLKVYDVLGREIATLVNEEKATGTYSSEFSTLNSELPSGIYFYQLRAGKHVENKKMILIK